MQSPVKDVAGMLRSFSYAARFALQDNASRGAGDPVRLDPWARLWERLMSETFLDAYQRLAGESGLLPADPVERFQLLDGFLLEKALYELSYELGNRPAWIGVPLEGIVGLLGRTR
jgi:maltose alpha-D-glucosyltransferase/alpha-amylase